MRRWVDMVVGVAMVVRRRVQQYQQNSTLRIQHTLRMQTENGRNFDNTRRTEMEKA